MSGERGTQQQVLDYFQEPLGYRYLGNWQDRDSNAPIEQDLLRDWLVKQGHDERIIGKALRELDRAAALLGSGQAL